MSIWRVLAVAAALMTAVLTSGCCCCCPTDALPTEPFTAGDFADIPPYPDAEQRTGDDPTYGLVTLPFQFITDDAEWKHYVTSDDEDTILDWYSAQMEEAGWIGADEIADTPMPMQNGLLFFKEDDPDVLAIIVTTPGPESGERHILIGRLQVSIGQLL